MGKISEVRNAIDENMQGMKDTRRRGWELFEMCRYGLLTVDEAAKIYHAEVNALRRKLGFPALKLEQIKKVFRFGYKG